MRREAAFVARLWSPDRANRSAADGTSPTRWRSLSVRLVEHVGSATVKERQMIFSMAHAEVGEAQRENLFGEWSDLVVGDKPKGLVACYLVEDGAHIRVAAVWHDAEAHDRALHEEQSHPAYRVFEAAGVDPHHAVMTVMGSLSV